MANTKKGAQAAVKSSRAALDKMAHEPAQGITQPEQSDESAQVMGSDAAANENRGRPDRDSDEPHVHQLVRPPRDTIQGRDVLRVPQKQGWHRRFIKYSTDRLNRVLELGYRVVKGEEQSADDAVRIPGQVGDTVVREVGGGEKQILVETPIDQFLIGRQQKEAGRATLERGLLAPGDDRPHVDGAAQYGTVTKT